MRKLPGLEGNSKRLRTVYVAISAVLILVLALPPLISRPEDVARLSAGVFTISYSCAVIVPVISGFGWDATGIPAAAFIPIALPPGNPPLVVEGAQDRSLCQRVGGVRVHL